ncbi:signal peptide prediction [Methylotenera sp.]|uniref:signal peptide prediction n=1 Tax=Methylotenera sp. TaxID=2051956 RepID=UPI002EDAABC2
MSSNQKAILKLIAYAWAAPNTLLGIWLGLVIIVFGGRVHFMDGVAEFHGGSVGNFFATRPRPFCFGAITVGHVILGTCHNELNALRAHEHVHVRQYERWGVFFLPAYALSSLWEVCNGRNGYWNNCFERQAYAEDAKQKQQASQLSEAPNEAS